MDYKTYDYRECLYSIIQYQQDIIRQYEEYIEKNIHQPIKKYTREDFDNKSLERIYLQRITIPQADIITSCEPRVIREFDIIKSEFPIFSLHLIRQYIEEELK